MRAYALSVRNTHALFSDTETSTGSVFLARTCGPGVSDDIFKMLPGTSKAHYVTRPGPFPPIARFDADGKLFLDFGEIRAGSCRNAPDVFRIKNTSDHIIALRLELSPSLMPFFSRIKTKGGNQLCPDQEKRVEVKLSTSRYTRPGTYFGMLTVSDTNQEQHEVLTVKVIVV